MLLAMPIEMRRIEPGVAVVAVSGRLVLGRDVERLETVVNELVAQAQQKFVLDLSAMDYADSSGIGTIVSCLTTIKKSGGEMRVAGANPRIQRMFTLTGITSLMSMYPTVSEAAAAG
jgi:anti-sigma B factor antagonist